MAANPTLPPEDARLKLFPSVTEALRQALGWIEHWDCAFKNDPDWPEAHYHMAQAAKAATAALRQSEQHRPDTGVRLSEGELCSTPLIEELVPRHDEWDACVTLADRYRLMKRRIKATFVRAAPDTPAPQPKGWYDNEGRWVEFVYSERQSRERVEAQARQHVADIQALKPAVERQSARITELEAALREAWQDVSTAPKMRAVLVAYRNSLGKWRVVRATYYEANSLASDDTGMSNDFEDVFAPEGWYEEYEAHEHIYPINEPPTHWQHLPAPPALPSNADEKTGS